MLTSNPSTSTPLSTSDQWASILRYDASRRQSSEVNRTPLPKMSKRKSEQASAKHPRGISIGDNLPHMPDGSPRSHFSQVLPRTSLCSTALGPVDQQNVNSINDQTTYDSSHWHPLTRTVTPTALKGNNSVLVDRELNRLRYRRLQSTQRHWRIYTGTAMLVVLGLCSFVLAKYILAYLALSPSSWVLSDATDSTIQSPDPLMRTLALICVCASAVSLFGALSSGFYLRFSRRHSCGTWFVWIFAITSTTINVFLCVANLSLIAIWHKKYNSTTSNSFAATRDVSLRCSGTWALDVLWEAAQSSPLADVNKFNMSGCLQNPGATLQAYLIAGGARLAIIVSSCSVWLMCLARYNRALNLSADSDEMIEESAEMHRLLIEVDEGKLPSMPVLRDISEVPGSYSVDLDREKRLASSTSNLATLPPPRQDKLRGQKTEPTIVEEVQTLSNVSRDLQKKTDAEAWSVAQMWNSMWGSEQQIAVQPETDRDIYTPLHERQTSKLGLRGWFSRGNSGVSEDHIQLEYDEEEYERGLAYSRPPQHSRTPSQDKRAKEGRHASAEQLANFCERESEEERRLREVRRRREQQQRLEFLAGLAYDDHQQREEGTEDDHRHSSRRSSQSAGDELPHMPELNHTWTEEQENDAEFWQSSQQGQTMETSVSMQVNQLYVRTMGKLIRTLSAIRSEGSQERDHRASQSGLSESNLY